MSESLVSERFAMPFLMAGQAQKEMTHNEALLLIDVLLQPVVENVAQIMVPQSPVPGQCWIVSDDAVGEWEGRYNMLACYTSGGWRYVMPRKYMAVTSAADSSIYTYDGVGWVRNSAQNEGFYVDGQQVLGARKNAVLEPTGGEIIDAELRVAFVQLLSRLCEHGLIEAA